MGDKYLVMGRTGALGAGPCHEHLAEAETDTVVENKAGKEILNGAQAKTLFPFPNAENAIMEQYTPVLRVLGEQHLAVIVCKYLDQHSNSLFTLFYVLACLVFSIEVMV